MKNERLSIQENITTEIMNNVSLMDFIKESNDLISYIILSLHYEDDITHVITANYDVSFNKDGSFKSLYELPEYYKPTTIINSDELKTMDFVKVVDSNSVVSELYNIQKVIDTTDDMYMRGLIPIIDVINKYSEVKSFIGLTEDTPDFEGGSDFDIFEYTDVTVLIKDRKCHITSNNSRRGYLEIMQMEDGMFKIYYRVDLRMYMGYASWADNKCVYVNMLESGYKISSLGSLNTDIKVYNGIIPHLLPFEYLSLSGIPYTKVNVKHIVRDYIREGIDSLIDKIDVLKCDLDDLNIKLMHCKLPVIDDYYIRNAVELVKSTCTDYDNIECMYDYFNTFKERPVLLENILKRKNKFNDFINKTVMGRSKYEIISYSDFDNIVSLGTLTGVVRYERMDDNSYKYLDFKVREKEYDISDFRMIQGRVLGKTMVFEYLTQYDNFEDISEVIEILVSKTGAWWQAWGSHFKNKNNFSEWFSVCEEFQDTDNYNDPTVIVERNSDNSIESFYYCTASGLNSFKAEKGIDGRYLIEVETVTESDFLCQSQIFKILITNGFKLINITPTSSGNYQDTLVSDAVEVDDMLNITQAYTWDEDSESTGEVVMYHIHPDIREYMFEKYCKECSFDIKLINFCNRRINKKSIDYVLRCTDAIDIFKVLKYATSMFRDKCHSHIRGFIENDVVKDICDVTPDTLSEIDASITSIGVAYSELFDVLCDTMSGFIVSDWESGSETDIIVIDSHMNLVLRLTLNSSGILKTFKYNKEILYVDRMIHEYLRTIAYHEFPDKRSGAMTKICDEIQSYLE